MPHKNARVRQTIVDNEKLTILQWYLTMTADVPPAEQCETTEGYLTKWWLEPVLPDVANPGLEIYDDGDRWHIKRVPVYKGIKTR